MDASELTKRLDRSHGDLARRDLALEFPGEL